MLQIDMKPSDISKTTLEKANVNTSRHTINPPQGLNSYNSLNRQNRIKNLANIVDQNKLILNKL